MVDFDRLTKAERAIYHRTITSSHERRIEVHVLTLNGRVLRSLSPTIMEGQVDVDVDRLPSRVLTLSFLDPRRTLGFEPAQAGAVPLHRSRMIRVVDARRIRGLDDWVDCTVFTGHIVNFARVGPMAALTCHGVDTMASGTARRAFVRRRKAKATRVIRELLQEAGAVKFDLPDLDASLPEAVTVVTHVKDGDDKDDKPDKGPRKLKVHKGDTYYGEAKAIADALDRHLYADAEGRFVLRGFPEKPVLHLGDRFLLSDLETKRAADGVENVFEVRGADPKGPKKRVSAVAAFPPSHPLSRESLAWNGKPFELRRITENGSLRTNKACKSVAVRQRDNAVRIPTEFSVDVLPVPWLAEHDMVQVADAGGAVPIRMRRWSLPLGPGPDAMTIGSLRRSVRGERIR